MNKSCKQYCIAYLHTEMFFSFFLSSSFFFNLFCSFSWIFSVLAAFHFLFLANKHTELREWKKKLPNRNLLSSQQTWEENKRSTRNSGFEVDILWKTTKNSGNHNEERKKIILFIYFVAFIQSFIIILCSSFVFSFYFSFRCFCSADFLHFITEILFCTYTQFTHIFDTIENCFIHYMLTYHLVWNAYKHNGVLQKAALMRHIYSFREHIHIHS